MPARSDRSYRPANPNREQRHAVRPGRDVWQSRIGFGGKTYLLRVFVEYRPRSGGRIGLCPLRAGLTRLLSQQLVESLAALHAVDPVQVGLETRGRPAGFLARTVDGWAARGAAVADLINMIISDVEP